MLAYVVPRAIIIWLVIIAAAWLANGWRLALIADVRNVQMSIRENAAVNGMLNARYAGDGFMPSPTPLPPSCSALSQANHCTEPPRHR